MRARRGAPFARAGDGVVSALIDAGLADDAANYISHIADALAFDRRDTLAAHAQWLAAHVKAHGVAAGDVAAVFACVREALGGSSRAVELLDAAVRSR